MPDPMCPETGTPMKRGVAPMTIVNGTERSPLFGTIRCPIFGALRETHPGGYPAAALPSSSFAGALSMPALRLLLSR